MSLSMILPLNFGGSGFESFSDEEVSAAIKQNLTMLLLTAPGEYVMDANFGVGIGSYLFEQGAEDIGSIIKSRIYDQSALYLPYIRINNIEVDFSDLSFNIIRVKLNYSISNSVADEVFELITAV